jgi:clan AA aspartic protease (TIGR02281 family)
MIATMLLATTALGMIAYKTVFPPPPPPPQPQPQPQPQVIAEQEPPKPPPVEQILCSHMMDDAIIASIKQKSKTRSDDSRPEYRQSNYGPSWEPPTFCGTAKELEATAAHFNLASFSIYAAGYSSIQVRADSHGHFIPKVSIDGFPVRMMVDTGATVVTLSEKYQGLAAGLESKDCNSSTANGNAKRKCFTLPEITIEGFVLRNVPASCCATGIDESLLGMSALSRFALSFNDGWMTLRPR